MKRLFTPLNVAVLVSLPLLLWGCGGAATTEETGDTTTAEPEVMLGEGASRTIREVLQYDEENNFSFLLDAAQAVNALNALEGGGPLTVFAPTDGAFGMMSGASTLLDDTSRYGAVRKLLAHHIVEGYYPSDSLRDDQALITLAGDSLMVDVTAGTVTVGGVIVQRADVEAANGVVHVLPQVMLPGRTDEED
ncbi:MAG: fasciclin domain-containing protein [Catalinimonas sp.]